VANYVLTCKVDAPYLLQEGVAVADFPVLFKIPLANAANLFGTGETGDTVYWECEGEVLKHECVAIDADYAYFWVKLDLETDSEKIVNLHYGPLVDNNYEDKRAVWVNGGSIWHFHNGLTDTMGVSTGTKTGSLAYTTGAGKYYKGYYATTNTCGFTFTPIYLLGTTYTIMALGVYSPPLTLDGTNSLFLCCGSPTGYGFGLMRHSGVSGVYYAFSGSSLSDTQARIAGDIDYSQGFDKNFTCIRYGTGNNHIFVQDAKAITATYLSTCPASISCNTVGTHAYSLPFKMAELWIFTDSKALEWVYAMHRMYKNLSAYVEIGTEVDLGNLTDFTDEKVCCIANIVRQLEIYDYDFKKMVYEVGDKNALWRPPGSEGIYVWGKLEMRPLYGEDVSFVDNLYANDAYFYTFTDYLYDVHDKLVVEGVLYDIQAIQVNDAGRETIYKTLVLKRQPEYYACCVGVVS